MCGSAGKFRDLMECALQGISHRQYACLEDPQLVKKMYKGDLPLSLGAK